MGFLFGVARVGVVLGCGPCLVRWGSLGLFCGGVPVGMVRLVRVWCFVGSALLGLRGGLGRVAPCCGSVVVVLFSGGGWCGAGFAAGGAWVGPGGVLLRRFAPAGGWGACPILISISLLIAAGASVGGLVP